MKNRSNEIRSNEIPIRQELPVDIYASRNVCVKDIGSRASLVLQNYQKLKEITSNMIYIVALGVSLKYQLKIHLNTQLGEEEDWIDNNISEGFVRS